MSDERVKLGLPEPVYQLFRTSREKLPEIAVVNEALLSFEHTEIFPWHLFVQIKRASG